MRKINLPMKREKVTRMAILITPFLLLKGVSIILNAQISQNNENKIQDVNCNGEGMIYKKETGYSDTSTHTWDIILDESESIYLVGNYCCSLQLAGSL